MIAGGRVLLLAAVSVGLLGCATTQPIAEGPPPAPDTIEDLIYQWDAIERRQGPAPSAYRDQYVAALKALNRSLEQTEKWRHRAESK